MVRGFSATGAKAEAGAFCFFGGNVGLSAGKAGIADGVSREPMFVDKARPPTEDGSRAGRLSVCWAKTWGGG